MSEMMKVIFMKLEMLTKEIRQLRNDRKQNYKIGILQSQANSLFYTTDGHDEQITDIQEQMVETAYQQILDELEV